MTRLYHCDVMYLPQLASLACQTAVSQEICGQYETVPGSTVQYFYLPGTLDFETLPVHATFDISCNDYSLNATIFTPIIGIDEDGNEIFPTGLAYPIMTTSAYDPSTNYSGTLQGTQYNYGWQFNIEPGNTVHWNGFVSWFGGRYEETEIDDVVLTSVAEPTVSRLLIIGLAIVFLPSAHTSQSTNR